jgi:hypothetical protein
MIEYQVDVTRRLTTCRLVGVLDLAASTAALQRLLDEASHAGVEWLLWIFDDAESMLSVRRLRPLIPVLEKWLWQHPGSKWALVLPSHLAFAVAQSAIPAIGFGGIDVRCFLSETAATDWLCPTVLQAGADLITGVPHR